MVPENDMEEIPLHQDEVRRIYEKLERVQADVAQVRTDIAEIKIGLEHDNSDLVSLNKVIRDLDRLLYGKGDSNRDGLVTRVSTLEKTESKRQAVLYWLYAGFAALGLEAAARFLGLKN